MNIFPEIQGVPCGTAGSEALKKTDNQQNNQSNNSQNVTTQKTVSIFSNYDSDQNKQVNYSEGKSLFSSGGSEAATRCGNERTKGDLSKITDSSKQQTAYTAISNMAKNNLGSFASKFQSLVSNFNVSTGSEKYTYTEGDSNAESEIKDKSAARDKTAEDAAKTAQDKAITDVVSAYQTELQKAYEQYMTTYNDGQGNTSELDKTTVSEDAQEPKTSEESKTDEVKKEGNTKEVKTEKTAYATADKNNDGKVTSDEVDTLNKFDASSMKPTNMTDDSTLKDKLDDIRKIANSKINGDSEYQKILNKFSVNTGSESFTIKEGENKETDINNAIKEMDDKVSKAVKNTNSDISKLQAKYQNALNDAYSNYNKASDDDRAKMEEKADKKLEKQEAKEAKREEKANKTDKTDKTDKTKTNNGTTTRTGSGAGAGSAAGTGSGNNDAVTAATITAITALTTGILTAALSSSSSSSGVSGVTTSSSSSGTSSADTDYSGRTSRSHRRYRGHGRFRPAPRGHHGNKFKMQGKGPIDKFRGKGPAKGPGHGPAKPGHNLNKPNGANGHNPGKPVTNPNKTNGSNWHNLNKPAGTQNKTASNPGAADRNRSASNSSTSGTTLTRSTSNSNTTDSQRDRKRTV